MDPWEGKPLLPDSAVSVRLGGARAPETEKSVAEALRARCVNSPLYLEWCRNVRSTAARWGHETMKVHGVTFTDVDFIGDGQTTSTAESHGSGSLGPVGSRAVPNMDPLFVKFTAKVTLDATQQNQTEGGQDGTKVAPSVPTTPALPGIVFARGASVAVLPVLVCRETGEEYAALTDSVRVPVGRRVPEIPAAKQSVGRASDAKSEAMVNRARAVNAIRTMLGGHHPSSSESPLTHVTQDDLIDLTALAYEDVHPGVYPSGGGCDEYIRIYLFRAVVDYKELEALQRKGRKGPGLGTSGVGKGESFIVIKLKDMWRETPDAKALSALALYYNLQARDKV